MVQPRPEKISLLRGVPVPPRARSYCVRRRTNPSVAGNNRKNRTGENARRALQVCRSRSAPLSATSPPALPARRPQGALHRRGPSCAPVRRRYLLPRPRYTAAAVCRHVRFGPVRFCGARVPSFRDVRLKFRVVPGARRRHGRTADATAPPDVQETSPVPDHQGKKRKQTYRAPNGDRRDG